MLHPGKGWETATYIHLALLQDGVLSNEKYGGAKWATDMSTSLYCQAFNISSEMSESGLESA